MSWTTEYPRPQLRRESFISLNGVWKLNGLEINVPFPPQSKLSGFSGDTDDILYTCSFVTPEHSGSERVILHFGAVDQIAEVYINSRKAASHEGGYLPFSADITDALNGSENELRVTVTDRLDHTYPYGKQKKNRGGMWYTPVSGIWQSVWMEVVPEIHIRSIAVRTDMHGAEFKIDVPADCLIEIPGLPMTAVPGQEWIRADIPEPRLWSPDDPYLYHFTVTAGDDRVESYFALREIQTEGNRVLLNGSPVFLNGVLDQGYFNDGIFLPREPEEYERDILRMKELGINLLRKHIKIEPEAFYYACDRLGMLVMQDMVNSGPYNFLFDTALPTIGMKRRPDAVPEALMSKRMRFFEQHSLDTIDHLRSHPCVIAYTIFNEGWGQFSADRMYRKLRAADPTRLYDATSGWFRRRLSDFDSEHVYFRNKKLKPGERPMLLSECGGYTRTIPGHLFNENAKYGYGSADTEDALTAKIEKMWDEMVLPAIPDGLCGVIYTQLSDVEDEINGLYTYDRQVCKVDKKKMRLLAEAADKALSNALNERMYT